MKQMRNIGVLFLASVLGFFSCGTPNQNEDPVYTVTIVPQQFFLQRLIGNAGTVNVMVPPGASPETYDATPRQLQQLQKSNVYFMVGKLGYEQIWKERLQDQFPETDFINTSEGMALIQSEHSHGDHMHASVDPHVWMSPRHAKKMVKNMYHVLLKDATLDTALVRQNYQNLVSSMDSMHGVFQTLFSKEDSLSFIIFHPALTYFAHDYGLEQIEIEFEGKEPSPAYLKRITDYARRENVKLIFIQEEFDKSNATLIAREIGAPLVTINPLAYNWFKTMDEIATHFKNYIATSK